MKNLNYFITIFIVFLFFNSTTIAQVGIGTTDPHSSSMLDITSTSKGVLLPRMTTIERDAISIPVMGLKVFDLTTETFWFYTTSWQEIVSESPIVIYEDIIVPITSTRLDGTKDPTFGKLIDNGSGSQGVFAYWFNAGTEEEAYFTIQLPHGYHEGTDIYPHIHWTIQDDVGTNKVRWGIEYTWANPGELFGVSTLIYGSEPSSGSSPVAYEHVVTNLPIISGVGKKKVSMLICRIFRDATDTEDDFVNEAGLLEVTFHYEVDPNWH